MLVRVKDTHQHESGQVAGHFVNHLDRTVRPAEVDSTGTWIWVSTEADYVLYFTVCLNETRQTISI